MNGRSFSIALPLATLAALVTIAVATAKGSFDALLVYGEGHAIQVTASSLLSFDAFNDFSSPISGSPSVTTPGILIVRGATDLRTGEWVPIDTLRFFSTSLSAGSKPFVYYEGLVNGWSEYDAKWYYAKPEAAAALKELLLTNDQQLISQQSAQRISFALSALVGIAIGAIAMAHLRRPTN